MEATLTEMQAFHVKMKVLRFAPFAASTSHVQSPACVHENGKIHVVVPHLAQYRVMLV